MAKILTAGECNTIAGETSSFDTTYCPVYGDIESSYENLLVLGTQTSNQCVISANLRRIYNPGDICYWNGSELAFTSPSMWSSSLGEPLAVCVIPTKHAMVWGDGKARFMSIRGLNSDGSAATTNKSMSGGPKGVTRASTLYTKIPTWDNTIGGSVGISDSGYMSSDADRFSAKTNTIDTKTYYVSGAGSSTFIPSPYASDGSFYEDYRRTISGNNALSDFDGKGNTETLAAQTSYTYQSAVACNTYSTSGISAGEWYLPAMGELAYIMPRLKEIENAISACGGVSLGSTGGLWSSTEAGTYDMYYLTINLGCVYSYHTKNSSYYARPFVKIY